MDKVLELLVNALALLDKDKNDRYSNFKRSHMQVIVNLEATVLWRKKFLEDKASDILNGRYPYIDEKGNLKGEQ